MDLDYDDKTCAFRDEVRTFLSDNTESFPTKSYDTTVGFEQAAARRSESRRANRIPLGAPRAEFVRCFRSVPAGPARPGSRDPGRG